MPDQVKGNAHTKNIFENLIGDYDEVDLDSDVEAFEKKIFFMMGDLIHVCKVLADKIYFIYKKL